MTELFAESPLLSSQGPSLAGVSRAPGRDTHVLTRPWVFASLPGGVQLRLQPG